ncbi:Deoxyhypusine synthase [Elusimicrobium minutum Pei191]|uniref:Deoxyhypusine synthase-like protein n=1 Tax=Elusimicrobium minutum (strain Pei191) TaxID=445932 RepID=DHSL_ELUMP|nr:deoxyhypusine synthase [Elusimicrobium minutum]B2KER6.1 RecName: Full=Deoxyhypusine synthase-like protein [Elusimicrobium minutum Pei191]ACC99012.1 Deoxyhypusine synthase [Elusimicrobium minutum Pei191]
MAKKTQKDFLNPKELIKHIDIKKYSQAVSMVEDFSNMAYSSRDLARASKIYNMMLADKGCAVVLCLAGSLISAGLKKIVVDLLENNMIDAIVSTGANIVDQDFFEALGYKHYKGDQHNADDNLLRDLHIDRIYDTYINEDELKVCDETVHKILNTLEPRPYSSREIIWEMGKWLEAKKKGKDSIIYTAYKKGVPIFVPAFADCSAGFGFVAHQTERPTSHVTLDGAKDFLELTKIKINAKETGLLMFAGGVPKNFVQDTVVAAEILGQDSPMHKYAVQVTVADERDGALSGSTLKEASSWGKVSTALEQMVYAECTLAVPLITAYAYHKKAWKSRKGFNYIKFLQNDDAKIAKMKKQECCCCESKKSASKKAKKK